VYQTQAWGQELADMQGNTPADPMIANGQSFVMDSNTSGETMGQGWNVLIENFIDKFRHNTRVLPQVLQGGFPELEKLWGGATNHPFFNDNGKNGMLQIGSGEMAEWTTFWQYVNAYGPAIAQIMDMYTATDLYAASLNGNVTELGGYTPSGSPWLLHGFPDVGSGVMGGGAGPSGVPMIPGGSHRTVTNINVYAQFDGSGIADANMKRYISDAVAQELQKSLGTY
jgi:hypothetical protein